MHIITGLETGGAETMLYKLTLNMDPNEFENVVVSMTEKGPTGEKIMAAGIRVEALGMGRGVPDPRYIARLVALMRYEKPDLVQTWLYHSDLLGGLAARIAGIPVLWNIRQNSPRATGTKRMALLAAKTCATLLQRIPVKIVCCSEAALWAHHAFGYEIKKFHLIPNGFNLDTFQPDSEAYDSVRRELGLARDQLIIGHAARFHPMKDHHTLLSAYAIVHRKFPEVHFVLCGQEISEDNEELISKIRGCGIEGVCHLLGTRDDMPRLTAAFDIACLSSINGEGFPNVIGEAMACAVPCIVTDVGESPAIVDRYGVVVPPGNPEALAEGMIKMIEMGREGRRALGDAARQRIAQSYGMPYIATLYENLYRDLV